MIDIDNWMRELEEEEDIEIKNNEEYQTKLFEEYVLRGSDHQEERRKLNERYLSGRSSWESMDLEKNLLPLTCHILEGRIFHTTSSGSHHTSMRSLMRYGAGE